MVSERRAQDAGGAAGAADAADAADALPTVLLIGCMDFQISGGGSSKVALTHERLLLDAGFGVLSACPMFTRRSTVFSERWVLYADGAYRGVFSTDELLALLGGVDVAACFLHHTRKMSLVSLERILAGFSAPVVFFVHDFATVCASPTMTSPERGQCALDAPGEECGCCSLAAESRELFERHVDLFRRLGARLRVIAPSEDAAEQWRAAFSGFLDCPVDVRGHLEERDSVFFSPELHEKPRLAFVGSMLPHKGSAQWAAVVGRALDAFDLYHFGDGMGTDRRVREVHVDFHTSETATEDALLAHGIDAVFLYSQCPETYSYTLFESLAARAFVVTGAGSGNIARQVRARGCGAVFDDDAQMLAAISDGSLAADVMAYRSQVTSRPVFAPSTAFMDLIEEGHAPRTAPLRARRMWPETATYGLWRALKASELVGGAWRCAKRVLSIR